VTAIWCDNAERGWELLSPVGFADEAALHALVERTPDLLPLAGSPRLAVVGKEVLLGGNRADLVAIEPTGRPCIIEVKLAANSEARRAVVAQVLSYAAFVHRMTPEQFEEEVLAGHLRKRGYATLADAAEEAGQDGSFDRSTFRGSLADALSSGGFRLVLVLDQAPAELVRTVGFLQAIAGALVVDLVTVAAYAVGERRVLVPQRIEPDRQITEQAPNGPPSPLPRGGNGEPGAGGFVAAIQEAPSEHRPILTRLAEWAVELEKLGPVRLTTYWGRRGEITLLPRIQPDNSGLVTIWNWAGSPRVSFYRSVFERRAPQALLAVEATIAPMTVGQGNWTADVTEELLAALATAYREAVGEVASAVPADE
jgi:hypothetical protein